MKNPHTKTSPNQAATSYEHDLNEIFANMETPNIPNLDVTLSNHIERVPIGMKDFNEDWEFQGPVSRKGERVDDLIIRCESYRESVFTLIYPENKDPLAGKVWSKAEWRNALKGKNNPIKKVNDNVAACLQTVNNLKVKLFESLKKAPNAIAELKKYRDEFKKCIDDKKGNCYINNKMNAKKWKKDLDDLHVVANKAMNILHKAKNIRKDIEKKREDLFHFLNQKEKEQKLIK